MEPLELGAEKEFPRIGTRLRFPEALSSLVFVYKNEVDADLTYEVCTVTEQGVAYLIRVGNNLSEVVTVSELRSASSTSSFSRITAGVAMADACLILGTNDVQFASLHELCDDRGIARLWGLVSRYSFCWVLNEEKKEKKGKIEKKKRKKGLAVELFDVSSGFLL